MVEHVAETRIALRHGPEGLPAQTLNPVIARAADEAARQQVRDRIDVGLGDLAASDLGVDHARFTRGNGRPRSLYRFSTIYSENRPAVFRIML